MRIALPSTLTAALLMASPVPADVQTPCAGGRSVGVYHAYPECRTDDAGQDVWHVVTDAYYSCPPGGATRAYRIDERATGQPCNDPPPEQSLLVEELGLGDVGAQADGEFVFLECINAFWHRVSYQRHRLPDGGVRISRPATRLENTMVPCDGPAPPPLLGLHGTDGDRRPSPEAAEPVSLKPAITDATPRTVLGSELCVCGWFPDIAATEGITLNGRPLGAPAEATSGVLRFTVDPELPVGGAAITGDPAAGYGSEDSAQTSVIAVTGSIDRERLLRGDSTPLTLRIEGTEEPLSLRLTNRTPGIVSLEGGEDQRVTSSGGADNVVRRTVHAVAPGNFDIVYELDGASCPCSAASSAAAQVSSAADSAVPPPEIAEECIDSFRRGRHLANEARNRLLFGGEDPGSVAQEAIDELSRSRELLEQGIEEGAIGPETARLLNQYISEYEEQAEGVLDCPRPPEPVEGAPPELPETVHYEDYPTGLGETKLRLTVGYDLTTTVDFDLGTTIDWDDEPPRDTPPPVIYGEELDDGPVGIVLLRGQNFWIPEYNGLTFVIAKIYEPDPTRPGVWLPSETKKRIITTRFDSRSNETGMCLNADLPDDPQDSPDLFLYEPFMPGVECADDPTGRGHYGSCTTLDPHNEYEFYVRSEDYGSFSKMEAFCEDCVPLVPVPMGRDGFPPAVEEPEREKRLVTLPADGNDNQIADYYPPEQIEFMHADEDSEDTPTGDGTAGDGYSAYEEYRGFLDRSGLHERTDWSVKTLLVENEQGFPTATFATQSGLEVVEIAADGHRDRLANFNGGHGHVVDQHALRLVREPLWEGFAGYSYGFGPPINVDRVAIDDTTSASSSTIPHELGHGVGMRHHGELEWTDETEEIRPMTGGVSDLLPGHVHSGPELCGKTLPAEFSIGEKGDQASGHAHCIMRYTYWRDVYEQAGGDFDCMPQGLARQIFCDSPAGTGPNGFGRTAGDATVGDCKGQIVVNDSGG